LKSREISPHPFGRGRPLRWSGAGPVGEALS